MITTQQLKDAHQARIHTGAIDKCGSTLSAHGVWVGQELDDEERYHRRLEQNREEVTALYIGN